MVQTTLKRLNALQGPSRRTSAYGLARELEGELLSRAWAAHKAGDKQREKALLDASYVFSQMAEDFKRR